MQFQYPLGTYEGRISKLVILFILLPYVVCRCFDPSPAFPPPKTLSSSSRPLLSAFKTINESLTSILLDPRYNTFSYSLSITSSSDTLFTRYHTAIDRNESRLGAPEVDGDSVYRIASITKVFTVLGILQLEKEGKVNLDDSIIDYVPELAEGVKKGRGLPKGEGQKVAWKDITLRSLASQLSGLPRECEFDLSPFPLSYPSLAFLFPGKDIVAICNTISSSKPSELPLRPVPQLTTFSNLLLLVSSGELITAIPDPTEYGLPPISKDSLIDCDSLATNRRPCGRQGTKVNLPKESSPLFSLLPFFCSVQSTDNHPAYRSPRCSTIDSSTICSESGICIFKRCVLAFGAGYRKCNGMGPSRYVQRGQR